MFLTLVETLSPNRMPSRLEPSALIVRATRDEKLTYTDEEISGVEVVQVDADDGILAALGARQFTEAALDGGAGRGVGRGRRHDAVSVVGDGVVGSLVVGAEQAGQHLRRHRCREDRREEDAQHGRCPCRVRDGRYN